MYSEGACSEDFPIDLAVTRGPPCALPVLK